MGSKQKTIAHTADAISEPGESLLEKSAVDYQPSDPRVLIVDDERLIINFLETVLEPISCKIISVNNFYDALTVLETEPIDVLVSDIGLGIHNGMDVFAAARRKYPQLPAMLITGFPNEEDREKALSDGAFYFEKPISTKLFEQTIEQMIEDSAQVAVQAAERVPC